MIFLLAVSTEFLHAMHDVLKNAVRLRPNKCNRYMIGKSICRQRKREIEIHLTFFQFVVIFTSSYGHKQFYSLVPTIVKREGQKDV